LRSINLVEASPIVVEATVRALPYKREVVKATWNNQNVFAKIFLGKQAKKYCERDLSGVQMLSAANILTPPLLHQGAMQDSQGYVLIFKAIENSDNVEHLWLTLNKTAQTALAEQLVTTLAMHHNASLVQTDCYLRNFLFSQDLIYTLDGDGIRKYYPLTKKIAMKNLCALLSKFDVLDMEAWFPCLIKKYKQSRSQSVDISNDIIKQQTFRHRRRVAERYADQKVFRTCSDVKVVSTKNFSAISSKFVGIALPQEVSQYDVLVDSGVVLKLGNTCTVVLSKIDNISIVIKRYNIKGFWHFLNRMWRPSRAAMSWSNAHRLIILGLATAKPVAILEQRFFGLFRGKAYYLSEYVDASDIGDFFKNTSNKQLRSVVVKQTVQLFYRLYLLKISHGDAKATNIKVLPEGKPLLIDLDSMRQHHYDFFAQKAHARDIKRFMRNWKDEPSLYNAFVKVFKVVYADHAPLLAAQILK
jgi:lipopolysaccharide kinase (Kdo/WaaP) family protein